MSEWLRLESPGRLSPAEAGRVQAVWACGGAIAYPTESFYGLGVDPWSEAAIARLLALKGERAGKPIPLILASAGRVLAVAREVPPELTALGARFWPGPLTLVLPAVAGLPPALTAGTGTIGVRVPAWPLARELARLAGGVLTSTSANRSGEAPPVTPEAVAAGLGPGLDLLLDAGPSPGGLPSTVIDLSCRPARLIRAGAIPAAEVAALLGGGLETRPDHG